MKKEPRSDERFVTRCAIADNILRYSFRLDRPDLSKRPKKEDALIDWAVKEAYAMFEPLELFFLDTIDTIPPQSMHILTTSPALPLTCPLSSRALARPAIILWDTTNTLNTMEMIPLTSFHVFIIIKSPFLSIFIT